MKDHYIGTTEVYATPMTRQDYNDLRGWDLPKEEDGTDSGFLVEQINEDVSPNTENFEGYVSWSPSGLFSAGYQKVSKMSFGHALVLLKQGKKVCRRGWNGKGMWICLTKGSTIHNDDARSGAVLEVAKSEGNDTIIINDHIDMRTADGSICCGWLASQADMLSEDWQQA